MCPMWDGDSCPCERFGFDKDDLPTSGIYSSGAWAAADLETKIRSL